MAQPEIDTVVFDLDGTLVDTVYQHTMIWVEVFGTVDVYVPAWRLHRAIGIGGDRLVAHVAGDEVEEQYGDEIRARHDERFGKEIDRIRPLPGAEQLLDALRERGYTVVLASSGPTEHTERLLATFRGEERTDGWVCGDDVESSKPAPDLIQLAVEKVGGSHALVVGDAVWDIASAQKAGLPSIGLRGGGFAPAELREAGADTVFDTPADLLEHLDETPLVRRR